MRVEWRDIPGYDGFYEASFMGEIRSWRGGRWGRLSSPKPLTPYKKQQRGKRRRSNRVYVKLTDGTGKAREIAVINIMADVWKGGRPPGLVAYHINGDTFDNRAMNIGFITRSKLGKKTGGSSRRRAVGKVTERGDVVEIYRSAREAARQNHMSYQTVLDRCNEKVKKPFALDGHTYRFED